MFIFVRNRIFLLAEFHTKTISSRGPEKLAFALFLWLPPWKMQVSEHAAFFWQSAKPACLTLLKGKTLIIGEHGEMGGHSVLRAWQKQKKMHSCFL